MKKIGSWKVCLLFLILLALVPCNIKAASALKLRYDGKTVNYSGKQVKVSLDGKIVSKQKNPGIIINNTSMVSYIDVFKEGFGAKCSYNAKTGLIQIGLNDTIVKLYIGSRYAYVNGVKKTISVTPKKIYYYSGKTTKIVVPARFVAEALGYSYAWNKNSSTSVITSPYSLYYNDTWKIYKGTKGKVKFNDENISLKSIPALIFNNTLMIPASDIFANSSLDTSYKYSAKTSSIELTADNMNITYIIDKKQAIVNGKTFELTEAPKVVKDNVSNTPTVLVPAKFTIENLGYSYFWNKEEKVCEITSESYSEDDEEESVSLWKWTSSKKQLTSGTTYKNLLLGLELLQAEKNETFTISTLQSYSPSIAENNNEISLMFSSLDNKTEKMTKQIENSVCIEKVHMSECQNGVITITLYLEKDVEYYISTSGKKYELHFTNTSVTNDNETNDIKGLSFKLPDKISLSDIDTEDIYTENKFIVTIPGEHVSYIKKYLEISSEVPVVKHQVILNDNNDTEIIITTSKLQGFSISKKNDDIYILIDEPKKIYKNIVVLDAGHGGVDPGTIGNGLNEKDVVYNVLYKYIKEYFNDINSPVKAYWTRTTDVKVALNDRPTYSKKYNADIFISLHMNSAPATSAKGTETYYSVKNNETTSNGVSSKVLANYIQNKLPGKIGLSKSRGVKTADHIVTKNNTVPSILIELGFLSNASDAAVIKNEAGQKKVAKALYETICDFFEEYPTER